MLSNDTKKIIDDARDTLVGQIPVPMMQCQQITLALTYKFMSDDDQLAVDLGGQRHYFAGHLEKYAWRNVLSLRLDDTERSELYREGLNALRESESMPAVFREIFKDAVVPFGDHRTLALFLNTMDRMEYDDSEKLGDAYEYLLKMAEAQADAGQFRTPRHIINFHCQHHQPAEARSNNRPRLWHRWVPSICLPAHQEPEQGTEWRDHVVRSRSQPARQQPEGLRHLS